MTYEKYEETNNVIRVLKTVDDIYNKKKNEPNCDKHGMGFNEDSRFSAFNLKISFDSWQGFFGNSGCHKIFDFPDSVKKYFVKYLNHNRKHIFDWIANQMEYDNQQEKQSVIDKLKSKLAELEGE